MAGPVNPTSIADYSSVLVTGGTGFFGDAFVRHLLQLKSGPQRICIYSRSESKQAERRHQYQNDERLRWFIGDVRDSDRLRRAMEGNDLVVHAAALKRIDAVEYNVQESVSTNIIGTQNAVNAASDTGVSRFVFLSSDKACNPTTTYGMTKAVGERVVMNAHHLVAHPALSRPWGSNWPVFVVCRYGNVIGSTGSVVPTWRRMKVSGQTKVPISDPDTTRFWMSAQQAVELVCTAATTMNPAMSADPAYLLAVPQDLPAFRLGDLAQAMSLQTYSVGLRDQEKLHEEMLPGLYSNGARMMSVPEIRAGLEALWHE